jgi:Flp pilus assembly protein CpaB
MPSTADLVRSPLRARRWVRLHRRGLAGLLAAAATLVGVRLVQAPPPSTVEVWTAAHDLRAGQVLRQGDLRATGFVPDSVPERVVTDPTRLVGRTVAAPVRTGEPLTDLRVLGEPLVASYPGRVATPVRLADSEVVDLLRVGDAVDLVAADPQGEAPARVVSSGARVLTLPAVTSEASGVGLPGRLVLFAVRTPDAPDIAAAGVSQYLTVTLTP